MVEMKAADKWLDFSKRVIGKDVVELEEEDASIVALAEMQEDATQAEATKILLKEYGFA